MKLNKFLLEEMTWEEAKDSFAQSATAILPVGSIEQHGPHLPLSTDAFDAYWIAQEAVKCVNKPQPVVMAPVNYGICYHHMAFPGTISLSPETLIAMIYDIGCSLVEHGVKKMLIINGHGGNTPSLKCAAQKLSYHKKLMVFIDSGESAAKERKMLVQTENDLHSGEYETSTSLANREELVKFDKAVTDVPEFPTPYFNRSSSNQVSWVYRTEMLSKSGILGDATLASKEKGKQLWKAHIANLAEFIEHMKTIGP